MSEVTLNVRSNAKTVKCVLLGTLFASGLSCYQSHAYQVHAGALCVPKSALDNLNEWDGWAAGVKGINISSPAYSPTAGTPAWIYNGTAQITTADKPDFFTVFPQSVQDNSLCAIGALTMKAYNGQPISEVGPLIEAIIDKRVIEQAGDWSALTVTSINLYDQSSATDNSILKWTDEEIQYARDYLDSSIPGGAAVKLIWNCRTFATANQDKASNTLIDFIMSEGSTPRWLTNDGERRELLAWYWENFTVPYDKPFVWQVPAGGAEGENTLYYKEVREVVKSVAFDWVETKDLELPNGNKPFIKSSKYIIMPVTYNNGPGTHQFWPETSDANTYANTMTGVGLSLIEQKTAFYDNTVDTTSYAR